MTSITLRSIFVSILQTDLLLKIHETPQRPKFLLRHAGRKIRVTTIAAASLTSAAWHDLILNEDPKVTHQQTDMRSLVLTFSAAENVNERSRLNRCYYVLFSPRSQRTAEPPRPSKILDWCPATYWAPHVSFHVSKPWPPQQTNCCYPTTINVGRSWLTNGDRPSLFKIELHSLACC